MPGKWFILGVPVGTDLSWIDGTQVWSGKYWTPDRALIKWFGTKQEADTEAVGIAMAENLQEWEIEVGEA